MPVSTNVASNHIGDGKQTGKNADNSKFSALMDRLALHGQTEVLRFWDYLNHGQRVDLERKMLCERVNWV
jgi:hypothetical protein